MDANQWIALASVLASLVTAIITWAVMKRQFFSKKLSYTCLVEPILAKADENLARDLKVIYKGNELPEPTLVTLAIRNTGYSAVEGAEIIVQMPGTTYLIPGYFEDIPPGYLTLWDVERTDAEECTVRMKHINPGQRAVLKFLADETPKGAVLVSCPMPNVQLRPDNLAVDGITRFIVEVIAPQLLGPRLPL